MHEHCTVSHCTVSHCSTLQHLVRDTCHSHVTCLLHLRHASFVCHMTRSYVTCLLCMWHDSFVWDMPHSYVTWRIHMEHDSFICDMALCDMPHWCATWLIMWHDAFMCDMTHSFVWHYAFTRDKIIPDSYVQKKKVAHEQFDMCFSSERICIDADASEFVCVWCWHTVHDGFNVLDVFNDVDLCLLLTVAVTETWRLGHGMGHWDVCVIATQCNTQYMIPVLPCASVSFWLWRCCIWVAQQLS